MRAPLSAVLAAAAVLAALTSAAPAAAKPCGLSPKQVVTRFMDEFYTRKQVRSAFERWVDPGYIQHNPMAATGRDAAIAFLEPFFAANPAVRYEIKRVIADGNLVVVHSQGWLGVSGSGGDNSVAVVDILRVQGCKIMEHWDVVQPVPDTAANQNGMF